MVGVLLVSLGYYTYFTASRWQATPGKRLLSIYVVRTDNRALTPRDALERFLGFILPSLPIYSSIMLQQQAAMLVFWLTLFWFAPILFTPERIGFHDRLCRTRVVVGKVGA
ncbi:MAG: RDD family protein [Rickettsiales bacterium]|nr:RDD family protein [Rickettsiales bacterium]